MQNTIELRYGGGKVVEAFVSFNASDSWYALVDEETVTRGHGTREGCVAALREMAAQKREHAEFDRQDAARSACTVYARHTGSCSLGTKGCGSHHGR